MAEKTKVELYEGELILACHQLCQRMAQKNNLKYSNVEGKSLDHLEQMATAMLHAIQECNDDITIEVLKKPTA